jgi:cbb3-type cytochrome oxidase subunit 1
MPPHSQWFIRSSLVHLVLGFTVGGLILTAKGVPQAVWVWRLLPLHVELLLFAWLVQLVFGVAYWMFPRILGERRSSTLTWLAFWLLNLGVWTAGLGSIFGIDSAVAFGRLGEVMACVAFVSNALPRLRSVV